MDDYTADSFAKVEERLREIFSLKTDIETAVADRNLERALTKIGLLIEKLVEIQGILGSAKMVKDMRALPRSSKQSGVMPIVRKSEPPRRRVSEPPKKKISGS